MNEKFRAASNKLQQNMKKINNSLSVMDAFSEGGPKQDFINKYGIELQMPASYIYAAFTYQPDFNYVISANCQIFPKDIEFYNYDAIGHNIDPRDNEYSESETANNDCLAFKTYKFTQDRYQHLKVRICSPDYQHMLCFSEDKTKVAIFRLEKGDAIKNIFKKSQKYVIDIFDCSSIDFFLRDEPLTPEDPNLLLTIKDGQLHGTTKFENSFMRFSTTQKYLYINQFRKTLLIYDISTGDKEIKSAIIEETIPSYYECILNVGIDENDIKDTLIAAKKTDFRNVEFFSISLLTEINNACSLSSRPHLNQRENDKIRSKYPISTLRLTEFNLKTTNIRFSNDHTQVIYCDNNQNIILQLAQEGINQHQKSINHIDGKECRYIARYEDSEFLLATSHDQDKEIVISHSSDSSKQIEFYIRFQEGSVRIRDIYSYKNKIRVLVTRDDEEFIVYEWEDFQKKETFWQRFFESSNYVFEWPYLCYLKGQKHILIQNAFNPGIGFYIELKGLNNKEIISNMYLTQAYYLYVIIENETEYQIYEKDLDKCMPYILDGRKEAQSPTKLSPAINSEEKASAQMTLKDPIARISKSYLNHKPIYRFFVRSSSSKEIIQTNLERVIFFLSDFKIYSIIGDKLSIVDTCYKFRIVNPDLVAYNTVDSNNKKTNVLKVLQIGYSDYRKIKLYEETDGKLIEFLIQDGQLLATSKQENQDKYLIKIFDFSPSFQLKLKYTIFTDDEKLIGNIQTVDYFVGNMIPAYNDLYTLVYNGQKPVIHSYQQIIPLPSSSRNSITFNSPLLNFTYRRMIYFVVNKDFLKPKRAIILPYLIDNYTLFNKRTNMTQFCQFIEYKNQITHQDQTDILCYIPFTQQILHYNLQGQLLSISHLNKLFAKYGEKTLAISPDGNTFLQHFEDETDQANLYILKMQKTNDQPKDTLDDSPLSQTEDKNSDQPEEGVSQPSDQAQLNTLKTVKLDDGKQNVGIILEEHIRLDQIPLNDEEFQKINKYYLNEIITYFLQRGCEVVYKMNNYGDILIGFLYTNRTQQNKTQKKSLKELLLLKKIGKNKRDVFKIRLESPQKDNSVPQNEKQQPVDDISFVRQKLLGQYNDNISRPEDQEYQLFLTMNDLSGCFDFCLTSSIIIVWSKDKIFIGGTDVYNSNTHTIELGQSQFQIENTDEAYISSITAYGQSIEDQSWDNYYIYLKIIVENTYSYIIKYNIFKNKEFSSFDCGIDAQIFFDKKCKGYILDSDSIIHIDQGIPLYFYKTGMENYNQQYLMGGVIDRGSRFCSKNLHFLIRNKVYIPYSYFILVMMEQNAGKPLSSETYDPESFYQYNGSTVLHQFANNYKALEFILDQYQQTNPKLLNLLFLNNAHGDNALQIAMKCGNTRCVKLILDKLGQISMNNIHALKKNFVDLLDYNGFEDYLRLCFFQTNQMASKPIFSRKTTKEDQNYFIEPHETSFLDKKFYENFQDSTKPSRQVIIRAVDAGWILKSEYGLEFQTALSNSDNMDYFAIDTVKLIVNYQWQIMKGLILKWLFIPFILNMILYNVYAIYTYEASIIDENGIYDYLDYAVQICILLFSIQTVYIEFKQIQFHRKEYLQSFWNMLDLSTVILAPLTVILDLNDVDPSIVRPFMAICTIIFYVRFFYFLRIFDSSAHLIRTIIEITYDIRYFIFVFFLGIVGFGVAFQILSNNNDPDIEGAQFINGFWNSAIYSYRLSLGDFQLDALDESNDLVLIWSFFVICSLFTAVILLNMLVAIMGESFNRVNEQSEPSRVREHLQLIVENDFLIQRKYIFEQVKYLIEIKDDVEEDDADILTQKLGDIMNKVKETQERQQQDNQEIKDMLKFQFSSIKNDLLKMKEAMMKAGIEYEQPIGNQITQNL